MRYSLSAVVLAAGLCTTSFLISADKPTIARKPTPPAIIKLEGISQSSKGYLSLAFKATNPTSSNLHYLGYTSNSFSPPLNKNFIAPLYVYEVERGGKWVKLPQGFCGVGIGPVHIPAKKTGTFSVGIPFNEKSDWKAVRVGIRYYADSKREAEKMKIAWSQPISLETIEDVLSKAGDQSVKR